MARERTTFEWLLYGALGVAILLFVAVVAFFVSPMGQRLVGSVREITDLAVEGMTAPGAAELVDAGCDQGVVTTIGKITSIAEAIVGEEVEGEAPGEMVDTPFVLCRMEGFGAEAPSCEALARVYAESADPTGLFLLVVDQGSGEQPCRGFYSESGERVGEVGPNFEILRKE